MKRKTLLRLIAAVMAAIGVLYLGCALTHPEFGRTILIGTIRIGASVWRACYAVYAAVIVILLALSFLAKEKKRG